MSATISANKRAYLDAVEVRIRSLSGRPLHVMEIGVGAGVTAEAIAGMLSGDDRLTAVDVDSANLRQLRERLETSRQTPLMSYLAADACELSAITDHSIDVVCSDTMLNLLGPRFGQWFAKVNRVLRPGGLFAFRELLPPQSASNTRRDLFLNVVWSARRLIGESYEMTSIETIESTLAAVGFHEIEAVRVTHPDGLSFSPEQWHPLSKPDCPLREAFIDYFERESRKTADDGPPLSASFHVLCVK